MLTQPPSHHFSQPHKHCVQRSRVGSINGERMLMADRFRVVAIANFPREPCTRILAASFPSKSQGPFPEALFQEALFQICQIDNFANPASVQVFFGDLANAGNLSNVQRSKESRLLSWND